MCGRGVGVCLMANSMYMYLVHRMNDLVHFISKHHPGLGADAHMPVRDPSSWSEGSFEFISHDDGMNLEVNLLSQQCGCQCALLAGLEF